MSETALRPIRHGSNLGQPLTRRDGILKVTGAAPYAADRHPPGMLHAVMAVSRIARGRVTRLNVAAAQGHPGVVAVMTPQNKPALAQHPDECLVLTENYESTVPGLFVVGSAGFAGKTNQVFIENGRLHADLAVAEIARQLPGQPQQA